jgi:hypothetical protein
MNVIVSAGILLLILALTCGCTTVSPGSSVARSHIPDLTGNWTGTMVSYDDGIGYNNVSGAVMTMMVTGQQDRIFTGEIILDNQTGYYLSFRFAGVIGHDGQTISIVEQGGSSCSGSVISDDEIELIYMDGSDPFSVSIDSLKKS